MPILDEFKDALRTKFIIGSKPPKLSSKSKKPISIPQDSVEDRVSKFLTGSKDPLHSFKEGFLADPKDVGKVGGTGKDLDLSLELGLMLGVQSGVGSLISKTPKALKALKNVPKGLEEVSEQLVLKFGNRTAKEIVKTGDSKLMSLAVKDGGRRAVQEAGIKLPTKPTLVKNQPVDIKKLNFVGDDLKIAKQRVNQGKLSQTKGNIRITPNNKGGFDVMDGHHRIAQALKEGARSFRADVELKNKAIKGIDFEKVIPESVQKITEALTGAKPVRQEQAQLLHKARQQQFAKLQGVRQTAKGEQGFFRELGVLKGELPKAEFESIRKQISQKDIDEVFDTVRTSQEIDAWEKLAAQSGLAKLFGATGGRVPTENELKLLNKVFGPEFTKAVMSKRSVFEKARDIGLEIINLPRALMSTLDLSAPFRQGVFLVGRPKQFFSSFQSMFRQYGSERAWSEVNQSIRAKESFPLMKQYKLALTDMDSFLSNREERFMSNWAERIPVAKHAVKASNRAYTGFLNKLRADVFDDMYQKARQVGVGDDPKFLDSLARYINSATGRGDFKHLNKSLQAVNGILFSPRLLASRLNLLNPVNYATMHPQVRKAALKDLFTFAALGTTLVGIGKMAGADVEANPTSADFGKIKVGNTRIDLWGGFQQYIKTASQLATNQIKSTTSGNVIELGEGFKSSTRATVLAQFLEFKTAPIASLAIALLRGKTALGEDLNVNNTIVQRVTPIIAQDLVELYKESQAAGIPFIIPAIFGVGVQTYKPKERKKSKSGFTPKL